MQTLSIFVGSLKCVHTCACAPYSMQTGTYSSSDIGHFLVMETPGRSNFSGAFPLEQGKEMKISLSPWLVPSHFLESLVISVATNADGRVEEHF